MSLPRGRSVTHGSSMVRGRVVAAALGGSSDELVRVANTLHDQHTDVSGVTSRAHAAEAQTTAGGVSYRAH